MVAISQKLLNEAFVSGTTAATARAFRGSGTVDTVHTVEWGPAVGSGVVTIESAHREDADDAAWAPVATVTFAGARTEAVHVQGAHRAFRHRISTVVVDGTVTTRIHGVDA